MVHEAVQAAIQKATKDAGQPEEVSRQLIRWLEELGRGSESLVDTEKVASRCGFLFESVVLEEQFDE